MVPGFVFFWTLLRVDPVPKAYPYLVGLSVTGVEVVGDAVLGLAVIAYQGLIAGAYYHAAAGLRAEPRHGPGARRRTLWILGDIVGVPFLAAAADPDDQGGRVDAAVIDAELDARDAARAAALAGGAGEHGRGRRGGRGR